MKTYNIYGIRFQEGKGTAKILLIGNSIAYRAYPLIHNILEGRYKTFRLYSRSCRCLLHRRILLEKYLNGFATLIFSLPSLIKLVCKILRCYEAGRWTRDARHPDEHSSHFVSLRIAYIWYAQFSAAFLIQASTVCSAFQWLEDWSDLQRVSIERQFFQVWIFYLREFRSFLRNDVLYRRNITG